MTKKKKVKWVQDGSKITLTIKAPRKHRRPTMLYSVEFNFNHIAVDDKKKVRYTRKQKHRSEIE